jgi:hypothetical protein
MGEIGNSIERSGCLNQLTPSRLQLKQGHSMAAGAALVEIELWDGTANHEFAEPPAETTPQAVPSAAE